MEDARIIKLGVITEDKSIKRYPVIIPNDIFDENTSCEYDKIIDLFVIINDEIKTYSVIVPKDIISTYLSEIKKRKLIIKTDKKNHIEHAKIMKLSIITEDKLIKRYPVIIPNNIFDKNESCEYDKIVDLYVIINDTIKMHSVIVSKDMITSFVTHPKCDNETKKRKLSIEIDEITETTKLHKSIDNLLSEYSMQTASVQTASVQTALVSPSIQNEHVLFSNNKSIISPLFGNERNERTEKKEINMIDNIIQYINTSFENFDLLYMKLTNKEFPDIENYFRECFKLNILNNEIHHINKNILYNRQIFWTNLNPEINVYILKYPINDYDSSVTIENIKRKTTNLVIFCERVLRWVRFCMDNKIETKEHKKFLNIKMNIYDRFFLTDEITRRYWNKYRLNIPMNYIYERLNSNVKIVFVNIDNFYVKII
jgi:hypothetical protein